MRIHNRACLTLLILTVANNAFGLVVGNRIKAAAGGAYVRDATLATVLFIQDGGVHGTITSEPVTGTAGDFTGNWWRINWDSQPPNQGSTQGWCAESVISLAPSAGDISQPSFSSSYYTTANHFWTQGDAPGTSVPGNPWPAGAYGNCTWYAYGRMLELGYSATQLASVAPPGQGDAYKWANNAINAGILVNTTPTVGSIAQLDSGAFSSLGHVAVVESVNGDGTITVSESSFTTSVSSTLNFLWRHRTLDPAAFHNFIHIIRSLSQQGPKLVGTGAVGGAAQGQSVSLSADGNTAIVGGYADNGLDGAVWVFTRSGGVWTQQGTKLVGSGFELTGGTQISISVSLSGDGNTAIIGAALDHSNAGAEWVFTKSGGVWSQQGPKLVGSGAVGSAYQGASVSLSGDGNTAIVGGPVDNNGAGAAWVWMRSGGVWTQQGTKLVASDAVGGYAVQGISVSLSADGNTAIVGGHGDSNPAGAAWVWTRNGGVWTQQGTKLVGSGGGPNRQGISVSLSGDGNTAIVGASNGGIGTGAAWVWTRSGGVWTQQGSKLVGSGAVGESVNQGISVSLSGDGNIAIVGGNYDNSNAGAAWVWTRS